MKHQMAAGVAGFSVGTTGAFSIGAPGSEFATVNANDVVPVDDHRLLTSALKAPTRCCAS